MDFKLLKYVDRYESKCTDTDGTVWHEATWGLDIDPADIKREALLLAEDAKLLATHEPEEIVIPETTKKK
jgi:hypothetical protein